jgi:transposase-like protein
MPKSQPVASYLTARRWSPAEGRAALAALSASGLSTSAFAAREGLDVQRLRSWSRRLAPAAHKERPRSAFVEVVPRAAERVEIALRSGHVLRVAESIDTATLRRLVEALELPSSC